jgi:metal-responsive CopG/Arc/MetJ family transcriptional regulator
MRLHISIDDQLVEELDSQVGARERSTFIERAVRHALDELRRTSSLDQAFGSISDSGHDWDNDPASWVRSQRTDRAAS